MNTCLIRTYPTWDASTNTLVREPGACSCRDRLSDHLFRRSIPRGGGLSFFFISAGPFSFGLPTYPFAGIKPFVVLGLRVKVALEAHLLGFFLFIFYFFYRENVTIGRSFAVYRERVKVALVAHLLGTAFVSTKGGRGSDVWSFRLSVLLRLLKSRGGILLV